LKTSKKKVCVLGAGVMGNSIAQVFASKGYNVFIRDIQEKYLQGAKAGIEKRLNRDISRGRLGQEDSLLIQSRISYSLDLDEALDSTALIIEAIPEILDLKKRVLSEVSEKAPANAVIASNTSSLSINQIAEAIVGPERFLGMHFFNPPTHMKLIEVIPGDKTSSESIDKVKKFSESIGKTPIVAKDSPGFIVNRVLITYLNEAAKQLDIGYNINQIDSSLTYNAGMPLGPFLLMDLIGMDIVHHILKTFEDKIGPEYTPHHSIVELYEDKKFGRKTGLGYYSYETRVTSDESIKDEYDHKTLLKVMVEEAEKVVENGIADKESVDTAMKLGANIPKGPFEIKEELHGN